MTFYKWSQTASADATADSTINWAEGQAPSSVNDSARAMMAATAKYRDDISGAIITAGTPTAFTISSYQAFDSLGDMGGQMIAFTPHVTNGATVTLNVDSLGARPLRSSPNVELLAGTIVQGTPYVATYNNIDSAFYLQNFFGNPYNIPLAAGLDFWGSTTPNSSFAFPAGQAISRTAYAALFAIMGTNYGSGDGATTFNLPNKTGRVSAMQEATPTLLTPTYFGGNSSALGAIGGSQSHLLQTTEMPAHQHAVYLRDPGHSHALANILGSTSTQQASPNSGNNLMVDNATPSVNSSVTGITIGSVNGTANDNQTANTGGGSAYAIIQPTIICNYILRII